MASNTTKGWVGPPLEHLQVVYTEMQRALDRELAEADGVDRKASTLIAVTGGLFTLAFAGIKLHPLSGGVKACYDVGLGLLFLSLIAAGLILFPRTYTSVPRLGGLWPSYATTGTEEMLADLCSTLADAERRNRAPRRWKNWLGRGQAVLLLMGLALLGIALVFSVLWPKLGS
ncbi:MAG: hypothetical protein ACRENL_00470 [Candidatus Dormibacteria bacterium]